MKYVDQIASYLPSLIISHLIDNDPTKNRPQRQKYDTVCVFADVSGFTALSEAMGAKHGPEGAEHLAKHLNSYFGQMVKVISSEGGDIFKFAGDAMIVLWPDRDSLEVRTRRAAQCALAIQEQLHEAEIAEGVKLSVKIGIGVGYVSVLHLGGALDRMEYVAVGEPLVQAFGAEHHAVSGGEVILSPEAWALVNNYFDLFAMKEGGYAQIKGVLKRLRRVSKFAMINLDSDEHDLVPRIRCYVPGAVLPVINPDAPDEESWAGELRRVTVLFVNLGLKDHDLLAAAQYDEAMTRAHSVFVAVQSAVYDFEGSINKFLMDDKGSTLIAVFGLPPLAHEDDATRGVLCGISICDRLWKLGVVASVGITTGTVFCGVVGSTTRKEFTVLGDTVNLSARLMQRACVTGGGILVDQECRRAASPLMSFETLGEIYVKGKTQPIIINRPYPKGMIDEGVPLNPRVRSSPFTTVYKHQHDSLFERSLLTIRDHSEAMLEVQHGTQQRPYRYFPRIFSNDDIEQGPVAVLLYIPKDFALGIDRQTSSLTYKEVCSSGDVVELEGMRNTKELLEACVKQAKEAGLLEKSIPTSSLALRFKHGDFVITDDPMPLRILSLLLWTLGSKPKLTLQLLLAKRSDSYKLQSRHGMVIQKLASMKMQLIEENVGGSALLEGEMGCGKTEILRDIVEAALPNLVPTYISAGSSFYKNTPFFTYKHIVNQFLDLERKEQTREEMVISIIQKQCLDLAPFVSLLNSPLGLNIKHTPELLALSVEARLATTESLMQSLMSNICERKAFIIIDDALYMDPSSWKLSYFLAEKASKGKLPALVVITTRPPGNYKHYLVFKDIPKAYFRMRANPAITQLKVGILLNNNVRGAIVDSLGSSDPSDPSAPSFSSCDESLTQLVGEKALGNPLVIRELVHGLKMNGSISVLPNGSISKPTACLSPIFDHEHDIPSCPSVHGMLGLRLDCLPIVQQLLLKVCACIGETFTLDVIDGVYPIREHKPVLKGELLNLENQGLIYRVKGVDIAAKLGFDVEIPQTSNDQVYSLTNRFMRDVLLKRMLGQQREMLQKRAYDCSNLKEAKRRREVCKAMLNKLPPTENVGKKGWLTIRKNRQTKAMRRRGSVKWSNLLSNEWKNRFVCLHNAEISIYKDEKMTKLVQSAPLRHARVNPTMFSHTADKNNVGFEIEVGSSIKKGKLSQTKRTYHLCAESEIERERWILWCRFYSDGDPDDINPLQVENSRRRQSMFQPNVSALYSPRMRTGSGSNLQRVHSFQMDKEVLPSSSAKSTPMKELHLTLPDSDEEDESQDQESLGSLLIEVVSAESLLCVDGYSSSNYFVELTCGSLSYATSVASGQSSVSWSEEAQFTNLTQEQVDSGLLHIIVRAKDFFAYDDFLGCAKVPINSVSKLSLISNESFISEKFAMERELKATEPIVLELKPDTACPFTQLGSITVKLLLVQSGEKLRSAADTTLTLKPKLCECEVLSDSPMVRGVNPIKAPLVGVDCESVMLGSDLAQIQPVIRQLKSAIKDGQLPTLRAAAFKTAQALSREVTARRGSSSSRRGSLSSISSSLSHLSLEDHQLPSVNNENGIPEVDEEEEDKVNPNTLYAKVSKPYAENIYDEKDPQPAIGPNTTWRQWDSETPDTIYYQSDGEVHGPYTCKQMLDWYHADYMNDELQITFAHDDEVESQWFALGDCVELMILRTQLMSAYELQMPVKKSNHLMLWEFDILAFNEDDISCLPAAIFNYDGLADKFDLGADDFYAVTMTLRHYMTRHKNHYHSYVHSLDVLQTTFSILHSMHAKEFFSEEETFALLVAAMCHDLDHPGFNNNYHIKTQSELAVRYNDQSVLENHHCSMMFEMLDHHDLLDHFSGKESYLRLRSFMIECILKTDMSVHFEITGKLNSLAEKVRSEEELSAADRQLLACLILHAADISNPCKSFDLCKHWSDCVSQECFEQGRAEKTNGLPISPNMDPTTFVQPWGGLGFGDFIIGPLYAGLAKIIPALEVAVIELTKNRCIWENMYIDHLRSKGELTIEKMKELDGRRGMFENTCSLKCSDYADTSFIKTAKKEVGMEVPPPAPIVKRKVSTSSVSSILVPPPPPAIPLPPPVPPPAVESLSCVECGFDVRVGEDNGSLTVEKLTWHEKCLKCGLCSHKVDKHEKFYIKNETLICIQCYMRKHSDICAHCGQLIDDGSKVRTDGKFYHLEHFTCTQCQVPLVGHYILQNGKPYCLHDHEQLFTSPCTVCGNLHIPENNKLLRRCDVPEDAVAIQRL